MGTTSEKLTYLNTTKGLIKDKLNLGGANITTEPFRAYSSKLMGIYKDFLAHGTDELWNNWEKVSGTGETLSLTPTIKGKMKVDLKGNTSQESTTGNNLFNVFDKNNQFTTDDDGWITATINNSSGSGTVFSNFNVNYSNLISADTNYAILLEVKSLSGSGRLTVNEGNNSQFSNTSAKYFSELSANTTYKYIVRTRASFEDTTLMLRGYMFCVAGESGSITFRISILANTSITPETFTYEPYTGGQPSPNPDYPQDIQVVSGDNTIKVEGKNRINNANLSYDYSNVSADKNTLATIDTGIRYSTTSEGSPVVMFKLFNLSQYIGKVIRLKTNFGSNGETRLSRVSNDLSLKEIVARTTTSGTTISYTVPSDLGDKEYLAFSLVVVGGNSSVDFTNLILTIDNNDMTYTPYVSQTYPISLGDIELCKIGTYQDSIVKDNGKWYLNKQIGKADFGLDSGTVMPVNNAEASRTQGLFQVRDIPNVLSNDSYLITPNDTLSNKYKNGYVYNYIAQGRNPENKTMSRYLTYFYVQNSDFSGYTDTQAKEALEGTIIYYPLATPTYEKITSTNYPTLYSQLQIIDNANSYDGTTNISQVNDDLAFVLDITALKEMS